MISAIPVHWLFFLCGTFALETLILMYLLDRQFEGRRNRAMLAIILTLLHIVHSQMGNDPLVNMLLSGLLDLGFAFAAYRSKDLIAWKVILVTGFYLTMTALDLLALLVLPQGTHSDLEQVALTAVTRGLLFGIVFLVAKLIPIRDGSLKKASWFFYVPLPALTVIALVVAFVVSDAGIVLTSYHGYVLVLLAVLFNLLALILMRVRIRLILLEQHRKVQEGYYLRLRENYLSGRILAHDLALHMATVSALLEQGKTDAAQEYICKLQGSMEWPMSYTGNETIDVILYGQIPLFEAAGVRLDLRGALPLTIPYDEIDLCAILGNALKNALEACLKLPESNTRRVVVRFAYDDWLQITVENPIAELPIKQRNGLYRSTKLDPEHGLGLRSIHAACKRQNGFLLTEVREKTFRLTATLQPKPPGTNQRTERR